MDLNQRKKESLANHIGEKTNNNEKPIAKIFLSPTDQGVILNGGKNGARFSPRVIINHLKKMAKPEENQLLFIETEVVSDETLEIKHFQDSQFAAIEKIKLSLKSSCPKKLIHLGGGHDHVYSFIKALSSIHQNIYILNIDAHADTRTDTHPHSGTPFRQLSSELSNLKIHQYGIQKAANTISTLSGLNPNQFSWTFRDEIKNSISQNLKKFISSIKKEDCLVISLDCDGLDMKAVSAANINGISFDHFNDLMNELKNLTDHTYFGVYEYNPMFDDVNASEGKKIAGLIYLYLLK
jgi:formiminoglutamase